MVQCCHYYYLKVSKLLLLQQALPFQESKPELIEICLYFLDVIHQACGISTIILIVNFIEVVTNITQQFYDLFMCVHLSKQVLKNRLDSRYA